MQILHSITCTQFNPAYNAHEEFQRVILRDRKLTIRGAERILRKRNELDEYDGITPDATVTRMETAIYSPR